MANSLLPQLSTALLKRADALLGRTAVRLLPAAVSRPLPAAIETILIIRPGGIGDGALLAPLVAVLRERFPAATITVLAERRNAGVFRLVPGVTRLLTYDRPVDLAELFRCTYDLLFDTEQWHRLSAVVARLTGAAFSVGFATNERSRLFTQSVSYSHNQYEAQSFLDLLQPLGIQAAFTPGQTFLSVPAEAATELEHLDADLSGNDIVSIFPGASIRERLWGTDRFSALAALFRGAGYLPVVVGGGGERPAGEEIAAAGGVNLAGRTSLAGTACLINRSSLLVSGDSGILHVGVGLGVPTVSLFGPGIAAKWGPRGALDVVVAKGLSCSPCTRFGYTPACPDRVRCLSEISVDDVFGAAIALLNKIKINASIPTPIVGQGG